MTESTKDYILGVERAELDRLRFQHTAWLAPMHRLLARAGLRGGARALDLGAGPGFTTVELARFVGPAGSVLAREQSADFLAFLRHERERLGLSWIEPSAGTVETLDLPEESVDLAYARWLLCWLPDPAPALERVVRALAPGGALVFQEYLDWAAMKLLPRSAVFDRGVAACMRSWEVGRATIDFAERAPEIAQRFDLALEVFEPVARTGDVGSLEWRWMGGFFSIYLPKLVERGLYGAAELDAWRAEWARREREGTSRVCTPTMADVVLRKR